MPSLPTLPCWWRVFPRAWVLLLGGMVCLLFPALLQAEQLLAGATFAAPEARQAAAADADFIYAVDSRVIAKYDRHTGQRLALSTGDAAHLNSAAWWKGKLYCAHSNYPHQPEHSEVKVLDPQSMELTVYKELGEGHGSLTWVVREGDAWWCTFAHYGSENARTSLVKYTSTWQEEAAWTYPAEVIARLGKMSISGGVWQQGLLLVTGHDAREIYRLRLPQKGATLELVDILPAPFAGQGISLTPSGELVGIDRQERKVIFATSAR